MCGIRRWIAILIFLTGIVLYCIYDIMDVHHHNTMRDLKKPETQTKSDGLGDAFQYYFLRNVSDLAKSHITLWHQAPWEPVDNRRIFMRHATENDPAAKQSCTAESVAKHNPKRQVQIFVRIPSSWSKDDYINHQNFSSPWWRVVQSYSNIQIVLYNEKIYFNQTELAEWYKNGAWKQSHNREAHLADYFTVASLSRGGGLFLDLDSALTLRPIHPSKYWNFFVLNGKSAISHLNRIAPSVVVPDIMHCVFRHHISDEMIWELSQAGYNPLANPREPLAAAVSSSLFEICSDEHGDNKCLDVKLLEEQQIFLPSFTSSFWLPLMKVFNHQLLVKGFMMHKEGGGLANWIVAKAIESHEGSLMRWSAMLNYSNRSNGRHENHSFYDMLYSTMLSRNCPVTVAHFFCVLFDC